MSFAALRKRHISEVVVGGLSRIGYALFSSKGQLSSSQMVIGETHKEGGVYAFHEGDLFTPGTGNWVMDASYETPVNTVWGHAFLRTPNTFNPLQHPQVMAQPTVSLQGVGGLIAGQMIMQPLREPAPEQGG
jgi:hypothetical protein